VTADDRRGLLPKPARRLFYHFFRTLYAVWLTLVHRLRARGRHRLPRGAYLIVSNHQSLFDPPIIGCSIPGEFHPLARATLFDIPVFGWGIRNCNAIPVRHDGGRDRRAIETCVERLKQGGVVAIFPEGARTPDGEIHPFLAGASLIARRSGVPVVPAAIRGAYEVWPRTRRLPRLFAGPIRLAFGDPIPPEAIKGMKSDEATALFEQKVRALFNELGPA